ncbi:MAG: hypothetical protein GTO55_10435 [Armatimonadetes bacterium]|nr:hypothetical protein [Armatimonadota bacterium]NIM24652.1 hypothetical protein [Armatimonadota bacterium]NIM68531.1 hypothetical protein [Armatimonadota bacterium]NIM76913.1 hypothetical protein [Armatimonadota bacterium]NIN06725.1 hypothetical protein [Armatimonadota bacterium]
MRAVSVLKDRLKVSTADPRWVAVAVGGAIFFGTLILAQAVISLFLFVWLAFFLFASFRPKAALFAYTFALPFMPLYFGYHRFIYPWGWITVAELGITALAAGTLLNVWATKTRPAKASPLSIYVLLFLFLILAPSLVFVNLLRFPLAVTHYLVGSGALLYFVTTRLLTNSGEVRGLVRLLLISGALAGILAVVESAAGKGLFRQILPSPFTIWYSVEGQSLGGTWGQDITRMGRLRVHLGMNQPLALGGWLAMLLPLALAWYALARLTGNSPVKLNTRSFALVSMVLIAIGILLTLSYSVWAATAFACVAILLHADVRRHLLPLALLAGLVISLAAFLFISARGGIALGEPVTTEAVLHSQHRVKILQATWVGLSANPLFGEGLEAEKIKGVTGTVGEQLIYREDMCNAYANLLLRHGLVGLAAFMLLAFAILWHLCRVSITSASPESRILAWALVAMFAGQFIALWAIPWFIGQHGHFFWIMVAIANRMGSFEEDTSPYSPAGGDR